MKIPNKNNSEGRVILVNPGIHTSKPLNPDEDGMFPNNAVQILGTILHQNKFEVKIVDGRYVNFEDAIEQIIGLADNNLIFVGFSVMTIQTRWAYFVSRGLKKRRPDIKIIWGGVHPSLFPEQTVSDDAVDICVVNDCASTIVQIAHSLRDEIDISKIPGLCYKMNHKIIKTQPNLVHDDFTNIPFIDFSIMNHKVYSRNNNISQDSSINKEYKNHIVYPINTAIGCNFRCTFCINVILRKKYVTRSAEEIIERIKFLQKEYGANYIHLNDENFFGNKKRIYRFVELLFHNDIRIKWRPSLRVNYFNDNYINESFVKELERSGMVIAVMGGESANQKTLDRLKKRITVEDIHRAVETLSKTKIIPRMSFMAGLPGETEEEMRETYKFVVTLREKFPTFQGLVMPFRLFPGSELYELAITEYGYTPPEVLTDWVGVEAQEYKDSVGYQHPKHYNWIKDKELFELRNNVHSTFTSSSMMVSPYVVNKGLTAKVKYLLTYILYKLSAIRLKREFYKFHFEGNLFELYKRRGQFKDNLLSWFRK